MGNFSSFRHIYINCLHRIAYYGHGWSRSSSRHRENSFRWWRKECGNLFAGIVNHGTIKCCFDRKCCESILCSWPSITHSMTQSNWDSNKSQINARVISDLEIVTFLGLLLFKCGSCWPNYPNRTTTTTRTTIALNRSAATSGVCFAQFTRSRMSIPVRRLLLRRPDQTMPRFVVLRLSSLMSKLFICKSRIGRDTHSHFREMQPQDTRRRGLEQIRDTCCLLLSTI